MTITNLRTHLVMTLNRWMVSWLRRCGWVCVYPETTEWRRGRDLTAEELDFLFNGGRGLGFDWEQKS